MGALMSTVRYMTRIAILSAVGLCLMLLIEVPLIPGVTWLKYDLGDIPVLIGAFALGPMAGVGISLLKNLIFLILRGTPEAFVGAPMNFLAGASFALCAGNLYFVEKTRNRAMLSLLAGGLFSTVVMFGANLLVLPWFLYFFFPGAPPVTVGYLLAIVVPFNLIKGGLNGVLVFGVYKRISPVLKAANWELPARTARPIHAPAGQG